ncbi:unnamed protein product [Sphagnum jensenii]|uniref:Uncharacterized protein n=1 Tax=Sphagnum jensenii TaxID=128206 RepID=A0ABP0WYF0_9BRYO
MLRILGRLVWWAPYPLPSVLGLGRRSSGSAVVKAPPAAAVRWFAKTKYPAIQDRIGEQSKYKDLEDWEFAGDEEETKEVENDFRFQAEALHLAMVQAPQQHASGYAWTSETANEARFSVEDEDDEEYRASPPPSVVASGVEMDWVEPQPLQLVPDQGGKETILLDAFHQFQHNPQIQDMVVALAADKEVWGAVLANEVIQDYKRDLGHHGVTAKVEKGSPYSDMNTKPGSRVLWNIKDKLHETLQFDFSGLFHLVDQKVPASAHHDLLHRLVKLCLMLVFLILIVHFFLSMMDYSHEGLELQAKPT